MSNLTALVAARKFIENYGIGRDTFMRILSDFESLPTAQTLNYLYHGEEMVCVREDWMSGISNKRKFYEEVMADKLKELPELLDSTRRNILYFDLETTDLSGGFSPVIMYSYKWNDGETKLVTLADYMDDLNNLPPERADYTLIKDLSDKINRADVCCAHFGLFFDTPFVQTRCLFHRLPVIDVPKSKIFDPWMIAKKQLRCGRRLKALAKQLQCEHQKTEVDLIYWQRSKCIGNNPYFLEALEKLGEYCIEDTNTLYDIAQLLSPLANHLPSAQIISGQITKCCFNCGSIDLKDKGYRYTKANKYKKYQCANCGAWMRGTKSEFVLSTEDRLVY